MEGFLKLGFFSMANKITLALGGSLPYIITGAVIVSIWIYFLFLVPKSGKRYARFTEYLYDIFNFEIMVSRVIGKILYMAAALVILVIGVVAMFAANFLNGLIGLLVLELILRVIFEFFLLLFNIHSDLQNLKRKALGEPVGGHLADGNGTGASDGDAADEQEEYERDDEDED